MSTIREAYERNWAKLAQSEESTFLWLIDELDRRFAALQQPAGPHPQQPDVYGPDSSPTGELYAVTQEPEPDPLGALREAVEKMEGRVTGGALIGLVHDVLDLPEWDQLRAELQAATRERDEARARVAELEARPFPDLMPIKDWLYEFEHSTSIPGEPQWVFERLRNLRRVLDSLPPAPAGPTWEQVNEARRRILYILEWKDITDQFDPGFRNNPIYAARLEIAEVFKELLPTPPKEKQE